jgi:hypothetical protein
MTTSAVTNQHPRFGFNEVRPWTGTLSDTALAGASFARTSGLFQLCVVADFELIGGSGEVGLVLEGSNDGTNWVALDGLSATDYFSASGQKNFDADCERWTYLRVRSAIISGTPVFSMDVWTVGIQGDSEKFLRTFNFVRSAVSEEGEVKVRPRGTKLVNVQAEASNVSLGGATSFDLVLQGSPNFESDDPASAVWVELGRITFTGDGSQVMVDDLTRLIDLECFNWFRFITEDVGGVGTSYTIDAQLSMDSGDWVLVSTSASGGDVPSLEEALLEVVFGTPGAEGATTPDTIELPFNIVDGNGDPVAGVKTIEFLVYDTSLAGDLDLAANATFSAVGSGATAVDGISTNRVLVTTDSSGQGDLSILDASAETVYVTGVQPRAPLPVQQLVWKAAESALTFA